VKSQILFHWIQVSVFFVVPPICNVKRDLKNARGGYLKSVCSIYLDISYDQAKSACTGIGMKLFVANSTEEINAITRYSNVQWPYGLFWVDGKDGNDCSVFSNDKSLSYMKKNATCTSSAYFHCEYLSKVASCSWNI
jgi:hypothetical protein